MRELINKIPNQKIRVFLKTYVFHRSVAEEMLDKVETDIIQILQEKSATPMTMMSYMVGDRPEDRLAVKQAVREKLLRKTQPSTFTTSFLYPFLVSVITTLVISKLLHWN